MQPIQQSGSARGRFLLASFGVALALTGRGMAATLDPPLATAANPMTIVLAALEIAVIASQGSMSLRSARRER